MKKQPEPKWILSEDFGIGLDPLNWRLYQRTKDRKTGERSSWKIIGYYNKPRALLKSLYEHVMLIDAGNSDLIAHINAAHDLCTALSDAFEAQMNGMGAGLDTLPPKYADYARVAA